MKPLVIFGNGRFAEVAKYYFERGGEYRVVAFTVDVTPGNERFLERPLCAFAELPKHFPPHECALFVAVGYSRMNQHRARKCEQAKLAGYTLASYLSADDGFSFRPVVHENSFILERNTIQPYVELGRNVVIWSGNHLGHHTRVGNHVFITSHVCIGGGATISDGCFIGMGATIRDGVHLGEGTLVGAGALIMKDTPPRSVFSVKGTSPRDVTSDEINL